MTTETVKIVITSSGAPVVIREFQQIGAASRTASQGVDFMRSALAGVMAYISVDTFINYADAATRVGNQLKMAGLAGQEFTTIQAQLYKAAIDNGQATEELATVYQKMMSVQENLGYNSKQSADLTVDIATAMRMASSSTAAQSGALQQLSQLMGGTKVQAQEFNSLIDGAYPLLMAAAAGSDRWKGSVAALRNDVKESNVTVKEFMEALRVGLPDVAEKAKSMTLTIGQAFVGFGQAFQQYLATSQQAASASGMLSRSIQFLSANMDRLVPAAAAVGAAMAATFGAKFLMSAVANVVALTGSLIRFSALLVTTVIPAIASATMGAISMGVAFVGALPGIAAASAAFVVANASIIAVVAAAAALAAGIMYLNDQLFNAGRGWADFKSAADAAFSSLESAFKRIGDLIPGKGLDVTLQGEELVKKLEAGFDTGGKTAASHVSNALKNSAPTVANTVKSGVTDGAKEAATAVKDGVSDGGATAGDIMKAQIEGSAEIMAAKFEGTGRNIYDLWNNWGNSFIDGFGTTIGQLLKQFQQAQTAMLREQAALYKAQANLANEQAKSVRDGKGMDGTGGSSSSSSSSSSGGSSSGGTSTSSFGFPTGNNGGGKANNEARPRNRGNGGRGVFVPGGANANRPGVRDNGGITAGGIQGTRDVNNINVFDLNGVVGAMGSKAGKDAQLNTIRANATEIAAILGIG